MFNVGTQSYPSALFYLTSCCPNILLTYPHPLVEMLYVGTQSYCSEVI